MSLKVRHRLHSLSLLALGPALAGSALAQWPTFENGDILSRPGNGSSGGDLWRVDPVAATSSMLLPELYNGYSTGAWMAFDPFRDGLLMYTSRLLTGAFSPRLLLVRADGLVSDLGFPGERISALHPVGDGRVYCTADRELSVIDALGAMQPILDQNGQAFSVPVDHLHYDAATNSLIGVARTGYPGTCTAFGEMGLHRYELDATGTALRSSAICTTYFHGSEALPIGFDPLPGGDLLLTLTSGSSSVDTLLRVQPSTFAIGNFAGPDTNDKDGGIWSDAFGAAVILEDSGNTFRRFPEGSSGVGQEILSGLVPGDSTTGVSTTFEMIDVERAPGACPGTIAAFGTGLAGTGGLVPTVDVGACPRIDSTLPVLVGDALPGGVGLMLLGRFNGALPLFGGTVYVVPPYTSQPLLFSDSNGAAQLMLPVPNLPQLVGLSFFLQAGFADPAGPQGVSLSAGLELVLG